MYGILRILPQCDSIQSFLFPASMSCTTACVISYWCVYRCGRTIGHLTVGEFTVTGVLLFLFAFLVSSWEMYGKAERRWLGTSPFDNERTIALREYTLRAYEWKSSELISRDPRSRVGTDSSTDEAYPHTKSTNVTSQHIPLTTCN